MYLGQKTVRENLIKEIAEIVADERASAELKAAFDKFLETKNNTKANDEPAKALIAELEKAAAAGCPKATEVLKSNEFISQKSIWIFGGDGWASTSASAVWTTSWLPARMSNVMRGRPSTR